MICDDELIYWDIWTPQQAYAKQSEVLLSCATLVNRKLKMTSIPDDLQRPLKKLLQVDSGLLEQFNGIVPDLPCKERLAASYELILTWAHLQPITLPHRRFSKMTLHHVRTDFTLRLLSMCICIVAGCEGARVKC